MIARRTVLILLNNMVGAGLGFFAVRYLARFPQEAYGAYAWSFSALGIATLVTSLGFREAHIKRMGEGLDEATANGTFFLIKLALTLGFLVLVPSALWLSKTFLREGFTDATTEPVFLVVTAAYAALSLRQFFDTTFQSHRHTARGESVLFVDTLFSVLGVALAWNLWARSRGLWTPTNGVFDALLHLLNIDRPLTVDEGALLIAIAYLVGRTASLGFAVATFFLHRYPLGRFSWPIFRSYRHLGLPLALASTLTVIYANIDRVFLGYFWDPVAVANFQIPYVILSPMLFVATAVATLLFPTISRLDAEGRHDEIRLQVGRAERYLSMLLLPQLVLALLFAREGINIFNEAYVGKALVLRLLLVYVFFGVLVAPARSLLLGTGSARFLLRLGIINVLVVVLLNLIVVPPQTLGWREEGAAAVAGIGALVGYAYTKARASRMTGASLLPPGLLRQLAAALLLGLLLFLARAVIGTQHFGRFWQLGLVAVVAAPLYLGLLALVGGFRRDDWRFLVDLLHPGKMAGYVGDELRGDDQAKP